MTKLFGAELLGIGLILMLVSYLLTYGIGLKAGLVAAAGAPMLIAGIIMDRSWARMVVFAVGIAMGCGWLYMLWIGV
jgi:type IV secretory pathway TrbL component